MSAPKPNPARERHWVCAQRLRERRLELGLTQREVVGRLDRRGNRTTNRALSAMENGRGLDLGMLPELAESLRCTTTYLLGLTADPRSWAPDGWLSPVPDGPSTTTIRLSATDGGMRTSDIPNGYATSGRPRRRDRPAGSDVP
jgi:transcriptional regulator with XRE-family HTH domain